MDKPIPNKWVRKAILTATSNMVVNGINIPVYDLRVPTNGNVNHYVLITTQTNSVNKYTKCGYAYESTVLLDIVTSYYGTGNELKRTLADDILDKLRELTNNLTLDVASGLNIHRQTQDFPAGIETITPTENIFRRFLRIEMFIN